MENKMEIIIKDRSMIKPSKETSESTLWVSDLDLLVTRGHVPTVYFYKQQLTNNTSLNFFEAKVLKDALSEVLVPFYPVAGRLDRNENDRIQINCNGHGALFIEAETTSSLDHFNGDFTPCPDILHLVPSFHSSDDHDISSYPLFAVQLTRFRCGSVCIGVCVHHILADGISAIHFINSWSDIARGMPIDIPPFINRTLLDARVPPTPAFHHIEYDPSPTMMNASDQTHNSKPTSTKMFKITLDQLTALKSKLKSGIKYSTFEILTAHIWCSVCKARELCHDQAIKLYIPTDGRSRFDPPLPPGYFGNVQFITSVLCSAGEIESSLLDQIVEEVHKSLKKMDGEYLKSALDYLKKQPDLTVVSRGPHTFKCPNLDIISWTRLPMNDADFGWGRPIYMGRAKVISEGMAYLIRSPDTDNTLSLLICLDSDHMDSFQNLFYNFL